MALPGEHTRTFVNFLQGPIEDVPLVPGAVPELGNVGITRLKNRDPPITTSQQLMGHYMTLNRDKGLFAELLVDAGLHPMRAAKCAEAFAVKAAQFCQVPGAAAAAGGLVASSEAATAGVQDPPGTAAAAATGGGGAGAESATSGAAGAGTRLSGDTGTAAFRSRKGDKEDAAAFAAAIDASAVNAMPDEDEDEGAGTSTMYSPRFIHFTQTLVY